MRIDFSLLIFDIMLNEKYGIPTEIIQWITLGMWDYYS